MNDIGECYSFIKNCDCLCPFCPDIKGLFSMTDSEIQAFSIKELKNHHEVFVENPADLSFSIFQTIFDLTFDDKISFLYYTAVAQYCRFLLSDGVPTRYKFPILLYFVHLIINFKNGYQILFGVSFLIFFEDFLAHFLIAFDLQSLNRYKDNKVLKYIIPKKHKNYLRLSQVIAGSIDLQNEAEMRRLGAQNSSKKGTTSNQTASHNFDDFNQAILDLDLEEVQIHYIDHVIWNPERNCFIYTDRKSDSTNKDELVQNYDDALTDDGKFSKYFWKLHFMHHCLQVVLEMVRKQSKDFQKIVETQLENFIEQSKEINIIFFKYSEKFIPTLPFHEDTECWIEIKNIIYEILVIL